ncbi:MAG: OB-fold nucleic acid binding domain-containing protein, partial [Salinigranum sp.]
MTVENAGDSGVEPDSNSNPDSRPVVYDLAPNCTLDDVDVGERYHAVVNGVVDYGVFVDVSDTVSGLIHESNLGERYRVGDRLIVELDDIRENGDVAFVESNPSDYRTLTVEHEPTITPIEHLAIGESITLEGRVAQIKQTGGPTVFRVADRTGIAACAAFEEAGVRAYPGVEVGDVVRVTGFVEEHDGALQVEVEEMTRLDGEVAAEVRERFEEALAERAEPHEVEPLIEWPAFEKLRPDLEDVARLLRRTVLEGRPIRVRHHADGDGMCASVPVQRALENFIVEVNADPDAPRHLIKRLPSKAPFYEMEDVTR